MRQDLGQILEKAVRQSGYPISKLAKRIGYTRQHIYNLFAQQQIDLQLLDEIGKMMGTHSGTQRGYLFRARNMLKEKLGGMIDKYLKV